MEYTIRKATNDDYEQIRNLFRTCFGGIAESLGALSPIENRYLVTEIHCDGNSEIVAISGILPKEKSDYNGYEITWTCSHPEFRGWGYITEILRQCESVLPDDHLPLYCSCWKIKENPFINMRHVMQKLGMHPVVESRLKRVYGHNKECSNCPYSEEQCYCCEDLYMKNR